MVHELDIDLAELDQERHPAAAGSDSIAPTASRSSAP
jgi:hypothetical protein